VFKLKNKLNIETIEEVVKIYKDERLKYDGLFLLVCYYIIMYIIMYIIITI